jgi:hypothetical protein
MNLLEGFQEAIKKAQDVIVEFSDLQRFEQFLHSGSISDKFKEVTKDLEQKSQDLQLGISVQHLFDNNQDKIDDGTAKKAKLIN